MLKIRFQRTGRKNDPAFRIVVDEHTQGPRAGKHVAIVGSHHPKTKETVIDAEAVQHWMGQGAQVSGTVHNLLVSKGVIEGKKVNVLPKKTPIVKEEEKAEEPAPAAEGEAAEAPAEEKTEEAPQEDAPAEEKPAA